MFNIHFQIFIVTIISTKCQSYYYNDYENSKSKNNLTPQLSTSYAFGYDIEDDSTKNVQFRNEQRHENGSVTGSYGYLQPDGNLHKVSYIADQFGYRASVEIKPRGFLKPIHINRPETQLFDFSSNLPPPDNNVFFNKPEVENAQISKPVYEPIQKVNRYFQGGENNLRVNFKNTNDNDYFKNNQYSKGQLKFPYNIPNYISKNVIEKPKYRMERGFVPYFPEKEKDLDLYKKLFKNYYVIPLK